MSASQRTDWALLLLRVAVGGSALLHSITALSNAHGAITLAHAVAWGRELAIAIAGGFVLIGLWQPVMAGILAALVGWPLLQAWIKGAGPLTDPERLFRLLATAATASGGSGKWGVGK